MRGAAMPTSSERTSEADLGVRFARFISAGSGQEYPEAPADAADLRQIAMIGRAGIAAYFSQQAAENREQLRGAGVERPDIRHTDGPAPAKSCGRVGLLACAVVRVSILIVAFDFLTSPSNP
jgi:hypothetical protein